MEPTASASMTARQTGAKSPGMSSMAVYGLAFAPDGRLATTSYDGQVRLYDQQFTRSARYKTDRARSPSALRSIPWMARSRSGSMRRHSSRCSMVPRSLRYPRPMSAGSTTGRVKVAWSRDGTTLYAGGQYRDGTGARPVVAWADRGRGARRLLTSGATNTLMSLLPLPGGTLLVAAQDPHLAPASRGHGRLGGALAALRCPWPAAHPGRLRRRHAGRLWLRVWWEGTRPSTCAKLLPARPADGLTAPPQQAGLALDGWDNTSQPTLNGHALPLEQYERSFSLALHPDTHRFVLGTEWSLRAYEATGTQRWRREVPGVVWAVNITGDGRLVVAAYGDGTIRWHRLEDGVELLAFMPHLNKARLGRLDAGRHYDATPGARGVLRWHSNRGWEAAEAIPVAAIPKLNRPTVLPLMIQEMDQCGRQGSPNRPTP